MHDATTSRDGAAITKANEMQGFLFAKPMPPEEAATLLSRKVQATRPIRQGTSR